MFDSIIKKSSSLATRSWGLVKNFFLGGYRAATHPITCYMFNFLKVVAFMVLILWALPWIYVQAEIPRTMRPVNYYDFLNCLLLLYLTYRVEILSFKSKSPRRRLRKDNTPTPVEAEWFGEED